MEIRGGNAYLPSADVDTTECDCCDGIATEQVRIAGRFIKNICEDCYADIMARRAKRRAEINKK